jgi:hypothetical protein
VSQVERVRLVVPRSVPSAVRAVEVPVFCCLRSNCNHVIGIGGPYSLLEEY